MKKIKTAMILSFAILMLASCSDKENADSIESKAASSTTESVTTTTKETTTTADSETKSTTQTTTAETTAVERQSCLLIDPENVPDYAVQIHENRYNINLEKISDNEYKTPDGNFTVTVDYEVVDKHFGCRVCWTNTSDQTLTFDFTLTDRLTTNGSSKVYATGVNTLDGYTIDTTLAPGETHEENIAHDITADFTELTDEVCLMSTSVPDVNGNTITYSVDPYPLVINYSR